MADILPSSCYEAAVARAAVADRKTSSDSPRAVRSLRFRCELSVQDDLKMEITDADMEVLGRVWLNPAMEPSQASVSCTWVTSGWVRHGLRHTHTHTHRQIAGTHRGTVAEISRQKR